MFNLKPTEVPEEETTHIQNLYFEWEKRHEADEGTKIDMVHKWENWSLANMHKGISELSWTVALVYILPFLAIR